MAALSVAGLVGVAAPAAAQSNVCQQIGPMMERQAQLIQSINALGRRNVDPAVACQRFGALVANSNRLLAFVNTNKDWCQIPDDFANNIKTSHAQASRVRGQACSAAAQRNKAMAQAKAQARQAQQGGGQPGGNPFGGVDGFGGGPWRVPQGAL